MNEATLSGLRSIIFSVDTMTTIIIYFLPKFLASKNDLNGSTALSVSSFSNINASGVDHSNSNINKNGIVLLADNDNIRRDSSNYYTTEPNTNMNGSEREHTSTDHSANVVTFSEGMFPISKMSHDLMDAKVEPVVEVDDNEKYIASKNVMKLDLVSDK